MNFWIRIVDTLRNTRFSLKPVEYVFETELDVADIKGKISSVGDVVLKRVRTYTAMAGYCRGNRLTLMRVAWSVRFLITARPFRAHMHRIDGKTRIKGNFRFSLVTKVILLAWFLNDIARIINRLRTPANGSCGGHIVSIAVLTVLLLRIVWQDKKQQQTVIEFMKNELCAELVK